MDTMDVEQLIGWDSLLNEDETMVRASVRRLERKSVRASCCVSVDPPWATAPRRTLDHRARPRPMGSMPGW